VTVREFLEVAAPLIMSIAALVLCTYTLVLQSRLERRLAELEEDYPDALEPTPAILSMTGDEPKAWEPAAWDLLRWLRANGIDPTTVPHDAKIELHRPTDLSGWALTYETIALDPEGRRLVSDNEFVRVTQTVELKVPPPRPEEFHRALRALRA
jgi:hypothetical protein